MSVSNEYEEIHKGAKQNLKKTYNLTEMEMLEICLSYQPKFEDMLWWLKAGFQNDCATFFASSLTQNQLIPVLVEYFHACVTRYKDLNSKLQVLMRDVWWSQVILNVMWSF